MELLINISDLKKKKIFNITSPLCSFPHTLLGVWILSGGGRHGDYKQVAWWETRVVGSNKCGVAGGPFAEEIIH